MKMSKLLHWFIALVVFVSINLIVLYQMLDDDWSLLEDPRVVDESELAVYKPGFYQKLQTMFDLFSYQVPVACMSWHYRLDLLPPTSIVIVFHDPLHAQLYQVIEAIFYNTPSNLLADIVIVMDMEDPHQNAMARQIFVDEFSARQDDKYAKVKFIAANHRLGLMRSWAEAVKMSSGEVIVFLRQTYSVASEWLPPLLVPIMEKQETVSVLQLTTLESLKWDWGLFAYASIDAQNDSDYVSTLPYEYGLVNDINFAIPKKFLQQLGGLASNYFPTTYLNLFLSLQVLQCGGRIVMVPCSAIWLIKEYYNTMLEPFEQIHIESDFSFEPKCQLKVLVQKLVNQSEWHKFYAHHPTLQASPKCSKSGASLGLDKVQVPSKQCLLKSHARLIDAELLHKSSSLAEEPRQKLGMPVIEKETFVFASSSTHNLRFGEIGNLELGVCMFIDVQRGGDKLDIEPAYCPQSASLVPFRLDEDGNLLCEGYRIIATDGNLNLEARKVEQQDQGKWNYSNESLNFVWTHQGQESCLTYVTDKSIFVLTECDAAINHKWTWIV